MRGFEIQFPLVAESGKRLQATIKCAAKLCPFRITLTKNSTNPMEEFKVVEIYPGHNH